MDTHSYDSIEVSCETVSEKRLAVKRLAKKLDAGQPGPGASATPSEKSGQRKNGQCDRRSGRKTASAKSGWPDWGESPIEKRTRDGVRLMDFGLYIQISRMGEQECHLSLRGMRWKSSGMSGCDFGAGGGGLTFGGRRAGWLGSGIIGGVGGSCSGGLLKAGWLSVSFLVSASALAIGRKSRSTFPATHPFIWGLNPDDRSCSSCPLRTVRSGNKCSFQVPL